MLGRRKRVPPRVVLTLARRVPCVGIRVACPYLPVACFASTRNTHPRRSARRDVVSSFSRVIAPPRVAGAFRCPGGRRRGSRLAPTHSQWSGGWLSGGTDASCFGDGIRAGAPHVHPGSSQELRQPEQLGGKIHCGKAMSTKKPMAMGCHSRLSGISGPRKSCVTAPTIGHPCQGRGVVQLSWN